MIIKCIQNHYVTTLLELFTGQLFYCPECKQEYNAEMISVEIGDSADNDW